MLWLTPPLMLPAVLLAIGDEEERSFMASLYISHHRLMRCTARRYLRQDADVEDVVSDALVALHGKLPTLRTLEEKALRAYIVTAVRNTALNALVKQRRQQDHTAPQGDDAVAMLCAPTDVERQVQLEDELQRVLTAIHALPQKEQDVMWLRLAQNCTNEEIAEATGLSSQSIRKYLSRARARVRAAVYAEGASQG